MDADRLRKWKALDQVTVAKNCPASWRHMHGDDQVRQCTHCSRNVYNLSNMTRDEAADLIERQEGKLCIRFYLRPDGKMMTRDCPRPVRLQVRILRAAAAVLGLIGFAAAFTPVYAGHAMSWSAVVSSIERQLVQLEKDLAAEKDPEARKTLKEVRREYRTRLAQALAKAEKE